jgi:hypothetical protein
VGAALVHGGAVGMRQASAAAASDVLAIDTHGGVAKGTTSQPALIAAAAPVAPSLLTQTASASGVRASVVVSGGGRGRSRLGQGHRQRQRRKAETAAASAEEEAAAANAAASITSRSLAPSSGCATPLYPPGIPLRSGGARAAVDAAVDLMHGRRDRSPVRLRAPWTFRPVAVAVSGTNGRSAVSSIACPADAHATAPGDSALFSAVSATSAAAAWTADEQAAASTPSSAMNEPPADAAGSVSGLTSLPAPGTFPPMAVGKGLDLRA